MSSRPISKRVAKQIYEGFKRDGDFESFLWGVSHESSWFGRFSRVPRHALIEELISMFKCDNTKLEIVDKDRQKKWWRPQYE